MNSATAVVDPPFTEQHKEELQQLIAIAQTLKARLASIRNRLIGPPMPSITTSSLSPGIAAPNSVRQELREMVSRLNSEYEQIDSIISDLESF